MSENADKKEKKSKAKLIDEDNKATEIDSKEVKNISGKKKKKSERGRSKSPSKNDRGRSGSRGRSRDRKNRSKAKGGKKALDENPEKWSRDVLVQAINDLGEFSLNRSTGSGSISMNSKKIMNDQLIVILEALRRFTEIQHVTITKCGLTDELFAKMLENLQGLRHLKTLSLTFNSLTGITCDLIISAFMTVGRKVEHLDLRNNNITDEDGAKLARGFPLVFTLNGIPMKSTLQSSDKSIRPISSTELDLSDRQLRLPEVAIICELIKNKKSIHVGVINLSNNGIDAKGSIMLCNTISNLKNIYKIDVSHNPVTNKGKNIEGIEAWVNLTAKSTILSEMITNGIDLSEEHEDRLTRSLAVNHAQRLRIQPSFFNEWSLETILANAAELRLNPLDDFEPSFDIDPSFASINNVPIRSVEVDGDEITITKHVITVKRKKKLL
jgi:hypothetical protein